MIAIPEPAAAPAPDAAGSRAEAATAPAMADMLPASGFVPSYRGLRAWQRALELAVAVHRLARTLPAEERDGLAMELRRAADGIAGAIAAGSAVWERAEYARALLAAQGLVARLETLVAVGVALGVVTPADETALLAVTVEVRRLIGGLARVTRAGGRGAPPPTVAERLQPREQADEPTAPATAVAAASPRDGVPGPPPSVARGGRRRSAAPA